MKHMAKAITAMAVAAAIGTSSAQAQGVKLGVAGTGLFSLEDGGGTAWGGTVLVGFGGHASSPIGFRVDASIVHISGETDIIGSGNVVYTFPTARSSMFHPYLLAGAGVYHFGAVDALESETKPVIRAGAGFDYRAGRNLTLFAEPSFLMVFLGNGDGTFKFLQVNLGVKFGLGG